MSSFQTIYAAALHYLMRREHSQLQLQQKLVVKFPEQASLIDEVIGVLASENYQSDARFADAYLHARVLRGNGPKKIKYELMQRGIKADGIEAAFARADIDWLALRETTRQKKFGGAPLPKEFLEKAKQLSYLQQKGF